ncbi:aromatic ring-hydroxylating dioxygenase subunit alpha [Nocardioides sp. L-11A]|uniref:aromatic ring-hydroxylating dioxygenase subunit alpha n=1 Tax=Nocardioides sp. L-11A TaxID=3043848 RepID=UPI00249A70D1|nr:aromatic ring-hydroxylating dioxygenase subunit alpha [Nocardioides sp. L-11A]
MTTTSIDAGLSHSLTETGRGTKMGEWLRRYWWPIAVDADLKAKPTFIKILGEELVLFRTKRGKVGLLDSRCAHRRANLCLGQSLADGVACRYHGWVFSPEGKVLETPGEPDETFKERVQQRSYPTQTMGGLIFAYFGKGEPPALPRFDFLDGPGVHKARFIGTSRGNWMQINENAMDPLHLSFTHAPTWTAMSALPEMWFDETEFGVAYLSLRTTEDPEKWHLRVNNLILPSIGLTGATSFWFPRAKGSSNPPITARFSVPMDDTSTVMFRVMYIPEEFAEFADEIDDHLEHLKWDTPWQTERIEPYLEYNESVRTGEPVELGYTIPEGAGHEDATVVGSMPERVDRENENMLPVGDGGITFMRDVIISSVEEVANGGEAKGTVPASRAQELFLMPTGERFLNREGVEELRQGLRARDALKLPG